MQDIGRQIDYYSWARGVSADGNMVAIAALYISSTGELPHPFWWTPSDGMQILMNPQGVGVGAAYGVSVDGHVVVGWALNSAWRTRAFRWVYPGRGGQNLGTLLDGGKDMDGGVGQAYGASGDGSVVIGGAYNAALRESAFRWTEDGGMQELGTLPGYNSSVAYGVSADGLVVVGEAHNGVRGASGSRAFRWTASGGMEDLNITYASLLTNGSVLLAARAISPNGRYIVGYGYNAATGRYEAFLLDVGTSR
jgi:probable HAF family extracellular repeat protein